MVKFCPKCNSPLLPKKKSSNKIVLYCSRCGYVAKVKPDELERYKVTYVVDSSKRVQTSKATEGKKISLSEEDREILQEYYKVFLESLQEESEEED